MCRRHMRHPLPRALLEVQPGLPPYEPIRTAAAGFEVFSVYKWFPMRPRDPRLYELLAVVDVLRGRLPGHGSGAARCALRPSQAAHPSVVPPWRWPATTNRYPWQKKPGYTAEY